MITLASARHNRPAPGSAAERRASVMPFSLLVSKPDDDVEVQIRRRLLGRALGTCEIDAYDGSTESSFCGIIEAEPRTLCFRENSRASIRYECSVDDVFFQTDVPRPVSRRTSVAPPSTSEASVPSPHAPMAQPLASQGVPQSAPQGAQQSGPRKQFVAFLEPSGSESPRSTTGATPPFVTPPSAAIERPRRASINSADRAADDPLSSSLMTPRDTPHPEWTPTRHEWGKIFEHTLPAMKAVWDGEDVAWYINGSDGGESGATSLLFGPPPRTVAVPSWPTNELTHRSPGQQLLRSEASSAKHKVRTEKNAQRSSGDSASRQEEGAEGLIFEALRYLLEGAKPRELPDVYTILITASAVFLTPEGTFVDLSLPLPSTSIASVRGASNAVPDSDQIASLFRGSPPKNVGLHDTVEKRIKDSFLVVSPTEKQASSHSLLHEQNTSGGNNTAEKAPGSAYGTMRLKKSQNHHNNDTTPLEVTEINDEHVVYPVTVSRIASVDELRAWRNVWCQRYLRLAQQTRDGVGLLPGVTRADSLRGDGTLASASISSATASGSLFVTLCMTQWCSVAPTKVSHVRFFSFDGIAVPNFHEVLRCLRLREPLPRTLPITISKDPLVKLLMASIVKRHRSHCCYIECFDVSGAVPALENIAAARGDDVRTTIDETNPGVRRVAHDLTNERRMLRNEHRTLIEAVQSLNDKAEGLAETLSSLTANTFSAGLATDLGGSAVFGKRKINASRSFRTHQDSPTNGSPSSAAEEETSSYAASAVTDRDSEYALEQRYKAIEQYQDDRIYQLRRQAAALAAVQRTWQEASTKGLLLRQKIAAMQKAKAEAHYLHTMEMKAKESVFEAESRRLRTTLDGTLLPLEGIDSSRVAQSVACDVPAVRSPLQSSMRRGLSMRVRSSVALASGGLDADQQKLRALASAAKLNQVQSQLHVVRSELAEAKTSLTQALAHYKVTRRRYKHTASLLFELAVLFLKVLQLYRKRFGSAFPDFLNMTGFEEVQRRSERQRNNAENEHKSEADQRRASTPSRGGVAKLRPLHRLDTPTPPLVTSSATAFPATATAQSLRSSVEAGTLAHRVPRCVAMSLAASLEALRNELNIRDDPGSVFRRLREDLLLFPVSYYSVTEQH